MRVLITGICGFVGASLARHLREARQGLTLLGIDNFSRPGSETNREALRRLGVSVVGADARLASDFDALPAADWVIDAAANPSVLAGVQGPVSPRQVIEHNLLGTVNALEYARRNGAGFVLLSSSRVYSIRPLTTLPFEDRDGAFRLPTTGLPPGLGPAGLTEAFPAEPPLSLYGTTKRASELLAQEYAEAYGVPVRVLRCGVLAGAGQFGRPDQGIFSFWIHSWLRERPLRYIGFGGSGAQVRDCLHPRDLASLLLRQMDRSGVLSPEEALCNVSGGIRHAMSLRQLSRWCEDRFGARDMGGEPSNRPMDVPWVVLDARRARELWDWEPAVPVERILEEIAQFAREHPEWLDASEA